MPDSDLEKFIEAQGPVYAQALAELKAGRKTSHWIWYVLPQHVALGRSPRAIQYGITDLDQARRYLRDTVLGPRLKACVEAVLPHRDKTAFEIFGSPDDMKFRSCLTLFETAAEEGAGRELFGRALDLFYSGVRDERTLALIGEDL